jgi:hypothetical protein
MFSVSVVLSAYSASRCDGAGDAAGDGAYSDRTKLKSFDYRSRYGHGQNQLTVGPDGALWSIVGNDVTFPVGTSPDSPYRDPRTDRLLPDRSGYALVPLIASGGPDEITGITLCEEGWVERRPLKTLIQTVQPDPNQPSRLIGAPDPAFPRAFRDNITNHDLEKK